MRGSVINRTVHLSGPIDVHVISHEAAADSATVDARLARLRRLSFSPIPPRRQLAGWLLAAAGIPLLTLLLAHVRESTGLPTVLLAYLALVVIVSVVGGTWPALVAAVAAFLCANWFFTPPFRQLTIAEGENVIALFVFLGIALGVSRIVDTAARRATEAARARSHARTLARLAATTGDEDPVPALLQSLRSAFALDAVAVLRRDGSGWVVEAAVGRTADHQPARRRDGQGAERRLRARPRRAEHPRRGRARPQRLRRPAGRGARTRPAARRGRPGAGPRRRPTSCAAPCCRRCRTTCARRWRRSRRAPRA